MFFTAFLILFYPIQPHSTATVYQTIWQAKPIKFVIKLYTDHITSSSLSNFYPSQLTPSSTQYSSCFTGFLILFYHIQTSATTTLYQTIWQAKPIKFIIKLYIDHITSPSLSNFILVNWNPLQHNPHHVLHPFLYFTLPYSTKRHHKHWIYQTIRQAKLIKFIIKVYADQITISVKVLPIKKLSLLRTPSFSKLESTVSNNSIFNTKYAEFVTRWKVFLYFHNPTCACNHPYNLHQKPFTLLQSTLTSLFHPYFLTK